VRQAVGAFLCQHRLPHGELTVLARLLRKSTRTLRTWKGRASETGLPGRPPHSAEARRAAYANTVRVWDTLLPGHNGWRSACAALERDAVEVPVKLTQESVRRLKAERRQRRRARIEAERVHVEVLARDAVWSADQTHFGRDAQGAIKGLFVRECFVARLLSASVGPPATGRDVVRVLEHAAAERGGVWPFVVQLDNGGENANAIVEERLRREHVIVQWNLPRTPEHNPRIERTIGDLKRASGLDEPVSVATDPSRGLVERFNPGASATRTSVCVRLITAWKTLDERTPRSELEGMTPAELDRIAPRAEDHACRARFYREVCEELERITLAPGSARARRKQKREAIWRALERHGLVQRTRGGRPIPTVKPEGIS
jgi:transposase InsO family protein